MSIRIKIIAIVLPLLIATLVITGRSSDLFARSGINKIANNFLGFKAEVLKKNADNQWNTLIENNLSKQETYVELTKAGIQSYAASLLKSASELIVAFDKDGNIALKTKAITLTPEETAFIKGLITAKEAKLVEPKLGGISRVAVGFYFEPFDWYFLVTEETSVFYFDIKEIGRWNNIILVVSILVSFLLLWFFVSFLTRPLAKVAKAMKDIMTYNDMSARVAVEYKDETGELAHTFNLMITELEKAYNQIKSYAFKAVLSQKKEQRIRKIFQKYVPKDVIDQFFVNPESMLVGENRVLSILFSDIRGFTTISESMRPDELVNALNRYFGSMVEIIMNRGGIVDKYIGDAIMAFFGAPVKHPDDALQSVYAGIEMMEGLNEFNKYQREHGLLDFHIGVGINYGIVTVGNIGCEKKMDYTVIGDMVNLASRLEGLTKQYHQDIVISESVRGKVVDHIPCRMLDKVAVKGKTKGVNIYTAKKVLSENEKRAWKIHGDAMRTYYNQNFVEAIKLFTAVQEILPDDFIADLFITRCKEFIISPPSQWDGVEKLKEK